MLNLWPSLSAFVVGLVVLIVWRLLGGRTTLGLSRTLLAFSWGMAGATIISIAAQRIAVVFFPVGVVAWTFGPLCEEAAKAVPVLLLAYRFPASRRLTIADYVLTGIASGLGFALIEGNFFTVVEGKYSGDWLSWFGIPGNLSYQDQTYWAAGHALWTGFIALGIGIGIRLWPSDARRVLPAAAAATLSLFEHIMFNWKGTHTDYLFGQIQGIARAPEWAEWLYAIDLHGLLTI